MKQSKILAIDDNADALYALERTLTHNGYCVQALQSPGEAIEQAREFQPDCILLDVMMPKTDGYQVVRQLKADATLKYVPVFLVTAKDSTEDIVKGLETGADGYITKPFRPDELLARVRAALRLRALYQSFARSESENAELRTLLDREVHLLGSSDAVTTLKRIIGKVALSDSPVLITGASGTGKELVARSIHEQSDRANKRMLAKNCAAFSPELIESEIFGHKKGAFTGATSDKIGLLEAADKSTLFLDEIGEMPLDLQAKLLRVLEDKEVYPVGDNQPRKVDTRILAATNRDMKTMIAAGKFREDLYYRLSVVTIELPDLNKRQGDIRELADHFFQIFAVKYHAVDAAISDAVYHAFEQYPWPGNIRELKNEIERVFILREKGEPIALEHLSEHIRVWNDSNPAQQPEGSLKAAIEHLECQCISEALSRNGGNKSQAAKELGISRSNLIAKVKQYKLED